MWKSRHFSYWPPEIRTYNRRLKPLPNFGSLAKPSHDIDFSSTILIPFEIVCIRENRCVHTYTTVEYAQYREKQKIRKSETERRISILQITKNKSRNMKGDEKIEKE